MGEAVMFAEVTGIAKKERGDIEYLALNLGDEIFKTRQGRFLVIDFKTSARCTLFAHPVLRVLRLTSIPQLLMAEPS